MSPDEFERAGLDKLTADELAYLNAWLARTTQVETTVFAEAPSEPASAHSASPQAVAFGAEQLESDQRQPLAAIHAHIEGKFSGWDGATIFRLDNGQVWRQRLRGRYRHEATNPAVRIDKGRYGYYLTLIATERQVAVTRIR